MDDLTKVLLDNSVFIIFGIVALIYIISLRNEYFPAKARYREDILDRYVQYELYKRYRFKYEQTIRK